jgi:hypothetical protein
MKRVFPAMLVAVLLIAGCAAQHPIHPGAANQFDSTSYDTLLVAHSVIESTKADLAANKFPDALAAKVKQSLNVLIQAYDVADTAYLSYHASAIAGKATPADQTALQTKLNDVGNATTALTSAKGGM